ncbi:MAG: permease [Defluviitaleaceae bacterium]|nr:permease [Defluviitaleaceae bacterium]
MNIIQREGIFLWFYFTVQFELIFRYYVFGVIIGSVISVFGKQKIYRLFDSLQTKKMGAAGVVPSCLLGIASPICMFGTIPIAAAFSGKGMRDDWIAAFMVGSVLLNPQIIILSAALGTTVLTIRIALAILCGIVAGLGVWFFYSNRNKNFFNFLSFGKIPNRDTDPNPLKRLLKNIWRNIKATAPYFLIGVFLSAAFRRYVPEAVMISLFGNNSGLGTLMAATIGTPLHICGGAAVPLIQIWLIRGMSIGSAVAFMIAGPALKITNLGALKIVLGARRFVLYILFIVTFAFIFGMLVDLFI